MISIGIDASLTGTAVCLWDTETQEHSMRVFTSNPAGSLRGRLDRYAALCADVFVFIRGCPGDQVAVAFIEGYSFASPQFAHQLGEYGGTIRAGLLLTGSDVIEVPPASLKKFITGTGNARKEQMIAHVCKRWGHIFATNDECDAYALSRCGECYLNPAKCDTAIQRDVIEKLKNPAVKKSRKQKALS